MVCSSIHCLTPKKLLGNKPKKIFEPSNGGTGTKLKTVKRRLISTKEAATLKKEGGKKDNSALKRIIKPKTKAMARFEAGPAAATKVSPHF